MIEVAAEALVAASVGAEVAEGPRVRVASEPRRSPRVAQRAEDGLSRGPALDGRTRRCHRHGVAPARTPRVDLRPVQCRRRAVVYRAWQTKFAARRPCCRCRYRPPARDRRRAGRVRSTWPSRTRDAMIWSGASALLDPLLERRQHVEDAARSGAAAPQWPIPARHEEAEGVVDVVARDAADRVDDPSGSTRRDVGGGGDLLRVTAQPWYERSLPPAIEERTAGFGSRDVQRVVVPLLGRARCRSRS